MSNSSSDESSHPLMAEKQDYRDEERFDDVRSLRPTHCGNGIFLTHKHMAYVLAAVMVFWSLSGLAFLYLFDVQRHEPAHASPIPNFPIIETSFGPSELFTSPPNKESDDAWEALAGPLGTKSQQGFIYLDDSSPFDITPGHPKGDGEIFGIAMYHQLHCLAAIRRHIWQLLDGTFDIEAFFAVDEGMGTPGFVPTGHGVWHLQHCFNLIRQGIQCAGDFALEYPTYFNDTPLVVGWNSVHQCKSWDAMWTFVNEH